MREPAGLLDHPLHQPVAERLIGGGGEEVPMPEPGGEPPARDVGARGERIAEGEVEQARGERPHRKPRRIGAERPEIADPAESEELGAHLGGKRRVPHRLGGERRHRRLGPPQRASLTAQQAACQRRIAGPGIA